MNHQDQVEQKLCEVLADRPRRVSELALEARRFVTELAPGSSELLYATYAVSNVFSYTGKVGQGFIHIATYQNHVNMGFNRGAELHDPDGILKGSGKSIRHVRLESSEDLKSRPLKTLIKAAIAQGKKLATTSGIVDQCFVDKTS